jgi:hypothetical protein
MSLEPVVPQSALQRLILERALAFAQQLEASAATAPAGRLLDGCEQVALVQGQEFLRQALTATLQQQVREGEKKGRRPAAAPAGSRAGTRARRRARS